jgi:hypothetical protein
MSDPGNYSDKEISLSPAKDNEQSFVDFDDDSEEEV